MAGANGAGGGAPCPGASVDEPVAGGRVGERPAFVRGWAMFPSETVQRVELTMDGRPLGQARVGLPRPDVAAVSTCPEAATSGWEYEFGGNGNLPPEGSVTLGGVVHGSAGGTIELSTVTVELAAGWLDGEPISPPCPGAWVDEPVAGTRIDHLPAFVRGWAMFASESVQRVELTIDGRPLGLARLGLPRPDVAAACECADAPISGWEYVLTASADLPPEGSVTLGGVVHGSAGGTIELPRVTIYLGEREPAPRRGATVSRRTAREVRPGTLSVLVLTHSLDYGGAQLYLVELLERLAAHGLRFTVVSPEDGPLRARLERSGSRVHVSPLPELWEHGSYDAHVDVLTAFASEQRFDLVIGNTVLVHYCAEIAARLGVPSILAVHESYDPYLYWALHMHPKDPAVFRRMTSALGSASAIVFEAAATRDLFLPYAEPERLLAMPYGIDIDAIDRLRSASSRDAARAALGIERDQQLVLCLGTIEDRKAQASVARVFGRMSDRHPNAVLALVGREGGSRAAYDDGIAAHLRRAGIADRVLIEPTTSDPFAWHLAADVLVCASDIESLPRVILEAMAFGTPVVSTDIYGIPEAIDDGVTGFLCGPRDEGALAEALSDALDSRSDHERIRAAATERVREHHDADRYAAAFRELVDKLVGGGDLVDRHAAVPPANASTDRARAAVARGLQFLEAAQRPDGALPSEKYKSEGTTIAGIVAEEAIFPTVYMTASLLRVAGAERICSRAADFVERHMEPAGVWRYLTRTDPFRDSHAPDVDDTVLACLLLRETGRDVPNNARLLMSNRDRSGQFYTWITYRGRWPLSPGRWRVLARQVPHRHGMRAFYTASAARVTDVDVGVNANVLLYLGADGNEALAESLLEIVRTRSEAESDRWYTDPFTLWYLISRALVTMVPEAGPILVERVTAERPTTPMQLSHAICVLLDWEARPPAEWVDALLEAQQPDGAWPRESPYTAWVEECGGAAMTTAVCVEALARWSDAHGTGASSR